jgi:hypothetical protein
MGLQRSTTEEEFSPGTTAKMSSGYEDLQFWAKAVVCNPTRLYTAKPAMRMRRWNIGCSLDLLSVKIRSFDEWAVDGGSAHKLNGWQKIPEHLTEDAQ